MTRFIRNIDGAVHSVADDFELPEGWEEATEADASPELLGTEPDPAVAAVELHNLAELPVPDSADQPAEKPAEAEEVPVD